MFLIKSGFFTTAKSQHKNLNILRTMRANKTKQKAFLINFTESNKTIFFQSPTLKTFNNYTIIMTNNSDKIRIL